MAGIIFHAFSDCPMRPFSPLSVLVGCLLAGSAPQVVGQPAPAAASSWYVGVAAARHRFAQPETVHTDGAATPYLLQPVQVVLGYRFANGQRLEAGFLYSRRAAAAASQRVYSADNRDYYYYSNEAAQAFAVSVLFSRPLLSPAPARRWQLDGRMGLSYLSTRFTEKYYFALAQDPGPSPPAYAERRHLGDLPVAAGLAASYRLGPHLDLTADASAYASWVLALGRAFGATGSLVGAGGGVGLRYNL